MHIKEYQNIFQKEEKHFFYQVLHHIILDLVKKYIPKSTNIKILDAGCGTGLLAQKMVGFGQVAAVDIHPQAIKLTSKRGIKVKKASLMKLPFRSNYFDLITCIDVLYHQNIDDQKALEELKRILKPRGTLIIRVPAVSWLIRTSDSFVHTRERYDMKRFKKILYLKNFKIKYLSFVNFLILPAALVSFLWQKIKKPQKSSPLIELPYFLNKLVFYILYLEWLIAKKVKLPAGLGIIAVVSK